MLQSRAPEHVVPLEVQIAKLALIDPLTTSPAPVGAAYEALNIIIRVKLVGAGLAHGARVWQRQATKRAPRLSSNSSYREDARLI